MPEQKQQPKTYLCDSLAPEVIQEAVEVVAVEGLRPEKQKPSFQQTADKLGLTIGELNSIRAKYRVDIQALREDLAGRQVVNGYLLSKELTERLTDPVALAEVKTKDLSVMAKQAFDSALNLANGNTGSSNTTINIGDIKVLQNLSMEMPEVKVVEK